MYNNVREFKLKKSTDDMLTITQKRLKYIEIGKKLYPNAKEMTLENYKRIRNDLMSGDTTAKKKLLEYSIGTIIESVSNIFAKYNVEEVLPFEEALSVALMKYYKCIKKFTEIPKYCASYKNSLINYYVYKIVVNQYESEKCKQFQIQYMTNEDVIAEIDKNEFSEISCKDIAREDFTIRLNKILKNLKPRDAEILLYRYGLKTGEEITYQVLGDMFGITRSGAEHIVIKTLKKIRKPENIKPLMLYSDAKLEI